MPQPSKGDRVAITARPAAPVGAEIKRLARENGVSVTDFVAHHLAKLVGMPEFAPQLHPSNDAQGELLTRGAVPLRQSA